MADIVRSIPVENACCCGDDAPPAILKMLLPPLTESTGDWYEDCAAAAAEIASWVSNCVGYFSSGSASFTAIDSGTSLLMHNEGTVGMGDVPSGWGSVNAEAGETISLGFSATASSGTPIISFSVYDEDGNEIFNAVDTAISGTLVSDPLPYSGRYIVRFILSSTFLMDAVTGDFTFTSSGTMSVNPIQALYDEGLDEPGRLDCGDSCP